MDSQDNITLSITKFNSTKHFQIDISDNISKNILFSINEYDDAIITNNSSNYDIFIEDIDDGGEKKISCGEKAVINVLDHPYPAMEYRIRIFNKITNQSKLYLYRINHSSSTTDSQYKTMVASVGQYDKHMLYEEDVKYLMGHRVFNSGYRNIQTLITFILDNASLIVNALINIHNNPVLKDRRIITKTTTPRKQSSKSVVKNLRLAKPNIYYSTVIIQYADFLLNQYLVYILRFSQIQIMELNNSSLKELEKLNNRLSAILARCDPNPAKRSQHTTYQINSLNKRIDKFTKFIECSNSLLFNINRTVSINDFANIEPSSTRDKSIVHYHQYSIIERMLYLPLFQGYAFSFSNSYSSILSSPIKQTSKLFEAYCLLSIDAAIIDYGFENITDELNYDLFVKKFKKDDYEIELMYEIDAKDVSISQKNDIYYISKDTRHISPDFYLIVKNKGIPTCFLVFDAKCRKIKYVQERIENGDYEKTIRDYLSLRYSTDDNPFFLPKIVDALWLIFPDDENESEYVPINKLEYKMTKLKMDGDESDFIFELGSYLSIFID